MAEAGDDVACYLRSLPGISAMSSPVAIAAALEKWVLVVVGPAADAFWKPDHGNKRPSLPGDHGFGVCLNCLEFSTCGGCPHLYAAGMETGAVGTEGKI